MKVALLGPEGTYTHQAAEEYFDELEPKYFPGIAEVIDSNVEKKFVPIENSLGGGVTETVDLLRERDVEVTGEKVLAIDHCLISEEDMEDIETVRSHPQALSQCREFLAKKGWEEEEDSSTARAVENLGKGEAAIASEIAARLNDANILEKGIQDRDSNVTRFLVLGGSPAKKQKSALILEPSEDRPGLLSNMLSCFSGHGINLTHIQSRPKKTELGEYYFYVEAEAGRDEKRFEKALKCLESYASVDVLGSFPA